MDKSNSFGLKTIIFPAIILALFFASWELGVKLFGVNKIILPAPSEILVAALAKPEYLFPNLLVTATESFFGFLLGGILALAVAIAFVYSRNAKNALYPFAIALKATPLIAIAPLIVLWFGNSMLPMIIMSALIAFFPILVNCVDGFELVEKEKKELFKIFGAGKFSEFFKLRLPTAMPLIFSSLKIASTLAVVGAIIGEFTGSGAGLGFVIVNASYYLDTPLMFAAIILTSIWGICFFEAIALLERKTIFFQKLTTR
jgi:NitT/TauT family transport system permease protein